MEADPLFDRLAELIPPPAEVPATDWPAVEADLGTRLPPDFKAFRDRWGGGEIRLSGPVRIDAGTDEVRWALDLLADLMEDDAIVRVALYPEPGGLLPFGSTESRWYLLWRTHGPPAQWPVVVISDDDPDEHGPVDTGLTFAAWLVGALESTLPEEMVPPELWVSPIEPPAGVLGHRWSPDGGLVAEDEPDEEYDPRPAGVLRSFGGDASGPAVALDLGNTLGRDRQAALDGFLLYLSTQDAALAAEVEEARARRSEEVLRLRSTHAVGGVARAAAAFVAAELGVDNDPEFLDGLLDDDEEWPPD